ncbi:phosphopantothenoylcysteine decarboxylase/phosphopantothenate--cysteine ligase [Ruminiclostridium sufflavum DSM 19573]|uniref:Coenzyme A biosynthesis bifunctional protein CoaBC n=1 Tax=Ruminiclostridium sufflavum DSM 19573 TaxID=1121337 RepID=A0A318Y2P0_9FIRM|nr:bifunctional phosphopantothenoylcysteine decarboxylase/phosphopantothenate--cysteine ligase CoaBC [Ruminiclostridium sufflavum]PYG85756.1 phosphopantothenoylcysteine decarboxylase/phosphopantothenate--cysteine ligase [Ruminiclostridium sufflavum DSM 19573]
MLNGKTVILGVTGSIAAYKMANAASLLKKQHCDVHVIMTENSTNFINPVTFETLTNNKCLVDTFDRSFQYNVEHVSLAKKADLMLIAPATANVIAKLANGLADDMLTTTALACTCKKIIAPAMNTNMYQNMIVQNNIQKLMDYGFTIIPPVTGMLACGDIGTGKMADESLLLDYIMSELAYKKDMLGLRLLITAGPTQESIDPVRYITNHSSGKMGYALAKIAMLRGAEVTLISGRTCLTPPPLINVVDVVSAEDMYNAVISRLKDQDIVIKAAAVADYCPVKASSEKIKKSTADMNIELKKTSDILKKIGELRGEKQYICGFSMETSNLIQNSKEKLFSKNIDMIVANNLKEPGAGFSTDTNVVTIITEDKEIPLQLMSKDMAAEQILTNILVERERKDSKMLL